MAASTCPPCPTQRAIPREEFSSPRTLIPTLVPNHLRALMILPAIATKKKSASGLVAGVASAYSFF